MRPIDKNRESYKKVVDNGRVITEYILPTLHDNQQFRVIKMQGENTKGMKNLPCYISVHGGANQGGEALVDAEAFRNMTNNTQAVYFFVDYRCAPYTKNPGQTEDVYSTIVELYNNPEKYGIDRHRISVGGRSTGCTLALGAALKLQEKGEEHMLKQLYLLLPSINNLMWTEKNIFDESQWTDSIKFMYKKLQNFMEIAWTHSTNDYEKETRENLYMFPGKASLAQVKKLPPTVVFTAEFDFYRVDAIDIAEKLQKAGKLLDFGDYGGCDHGFQFTSGAIEKYWFINDFTKLINTYL